MVVASIDLMDGKAVQLRQGAEKILEVDDPLALADKFNRYGDVAIIDLDAALGQGDNRALMRQLITRCDARVGGGIRTVEQAQEWIALGAKKVILGSTVFADDKLNIPFLEALGKVLSPQEIIIAIDARGDEIVTKGWKHRTGINLYEAAELLSPYAGEYLFTCVEREGTMQGIDTEILDKLQESTRCKITAAGGVQSIDEIAMLAKRDLDVQLGMALYTGKVNLDDAFIASLNWKEDLMPVITRDDAGRVLMLAYANRESLAKTFAENRMCYFSRSRNQLWLKGETSGHYQDLQTMRTDCDRDTLLATVNQNNVACHTGSYSCFGEKGFLHQDLYDVIADRMENPSPQSYTAKLLGPLLDEKIMEEAQELIEAPDRENMIWEAADLLYFWTAYLAKNKITIDEVLQELYRRRRK